MSVQMKLWIKLGAIALLLLLLQIPLFWVTSSIDERQHYREQAINDISKSWSAQQQLVMPLFIVHYQTKQIERVWDENLDRYIEKHSSKAQRMSLLAEEVKIVGNIDVQKRHLGIFSAPVYLSEFSINGRLNALALTELRQSPEFEQITNIEVISFFSDIRGITKIPSLTFAGSNYVFSDGNSLNSRYATLHTLLPADLAASSHEFSYKLSLKGSKALAVTALGGSSHIQLTSNWPHPSFSGDFLPDQRDISETGFNANWQITALASNLNNLLDACTRGNCGELINSGLSVNFVEPVNSYSLAERAAKYGVLFILLTFAAFFLFEVLKALVIHPLQYLMVGLSLSVFFLLLVALSEHLEFALAYLISAVACVGLIAVYTSYMLASVQRSLVLSGALSLIYLALYIILHSEDYAFVMGAVLLFAILAAVMITTRKLDWYALTPKLPEKKSAVNKDLPADKTED